MTTHMAEASGGKAMSCNGTPFDRTKFYTAFGSVVNGIKFFTPINLTNMVVPDISGISTRIESVPKTECILFSVLDTPSAKRMLVILVRRTSTTLIRNPTVVTI